jgi:hypothetical protein
MKYIITDWMSNVCFDGREFKSFDHAEEYLSGRLGDLYETYREEYYIIEASETRETRYLDANDPRSGRKVK